MNDDNLAVYQMRKKGYTLVEIAKAMNKALFYINDLNRWNIGHDSRLQHEDDLWQDLNYRRNRHVRRS